MRGHDGLAEVGSECVRQRLGADGVERRGEHGEPELAVVGDGVEHVQRAEDVECLEVGEQHHAVPRRRGEAVGVESGAGAGGAKRREGEGEEDEESPHGGYWVGCSSKRFRECSWESVTLYTTNCSRKSKISKTFPLSRRQKTVQVASLLLEGLQHQK